MSNKNQKDEAVQTEVLPVSKGGELSVNPECGSFLTLVTAKDFKRLKEEAAKINGDEAVVITATYKEFTVGESVVGIFTGMDGITPRQTNELTGEVELKFCRSVQWLGSDGVLYQCAGVALVSQFWSEEDGSFLIQPGTKIRITHTGKSNRTKLYEVGLITD